jgi:phosphatidylserine decarboxylase
MHIDPAGWPFVFLGLGVALSVGFLFGSTAGVVAMLLPLVLLLFFRDPERLIRAAPQDVLSPADGRVMIVGPPTGSFSAAEWTQVSIFLSPLNVHVNRLPVSGRVIKVTYHPGRFLPAYRREAGHVNERAEVTIDHDGQIVLIRQVVGRLARRVVCRVREGDVVDAGDRFGVMKFGSRMDVLMPVGTTVFVQVGDRVVAGVTRLAALPEHGR